MKVLLTFVSFHSVVLAHFNQPIAFVIGNTSPPGGAVTLADDFSSQALDLATACGAASCPSVVIFKGQQWGTINVINCQLGQQYVFINQSTMDLGIVIQQNGGAFGSKGISRFDLGLCFCLEEHHEEVFDDSSSDGVLLCR